MDGPNELSLSEIREYMLQNGCKVTNHALVKHFKRFLTNPDTQNEARKQFKTYVNILATIKNENNQKYLILRKKYINECPSEDMAESSNPGTPMSPGGASLNFEPEGSPLRQPPPYKPPPQVSPAHQVKIPVLESETKENYKDCINEFQAAVSKIDPSRFKSSESVEEGSVSSQSGSSQTPPSVPPRKRQSAERSMSRESSIDENKENYEKNDASESVDSDKRKDSENSISVKEATRKFNRLASEEEAKVLSPSPKKKPEKEKTIAEDKPPAEVTLAHPKAKEWIVSAAKANYQDLAKLASDYPDLVKLQVSNNIGLHSLILGVHDKSFLVATIPLQQYQNVYNNRHGDDDEGNGDDNHDDDLVFVVKIYLFLSQNF
ncbi:uncharacterized protein LOC119648598 [Hermetia illucens]|uniref:uncharacterized protein LOC119648598 n=1 Tax=Hermetia illucens TaxID=343691 RepID=UPI0018CC3F9E|nr:uncharacterized protein LOC119648598 [Hermetia illucens]